MSRPSSSHRLLGGLLVAVVTEGFLPLIKTPSPDSLTSRFENGAFAQQTSANFYRSFLSPPAAQAMVGWQLIPMSH